MIFYSTLIANQCIVDTVVHLERPFAFLVKKIEFFSDIYPSYLSGTYFRTNSR